MQNNAKPYNQRMAAPNRDAAGKQAVPNQVRNDRLLSQPRKMVLTVLLVL